MLGIPMSTKGRPHSRNPLPRAARARQARTGTLTNARHSTVRRALNNASRRCAQGQPPPQQAGTWLPPPQQVGARESVTSQRSLYRSARIRSPPGKNKWCGWVGKLGARLSQNASVQPPPSPLDMCNLIYDIACSIQQSTFSITTNRNLLSTVCWAFE